MNGPRQTVIAGPRDAVDRVLERAHARQVEGRLLPVACAFHTPLMEPAREPLRDMRCEALTGAPSFPVFSNLDASIHPQDPRAIAGRLGDHVTNPVRFAEMIMAMHDQGARLFIEVGPSGLLTPLIEIHPGQPASSCRRLRHPRQTEPGRLLARAGSARGGRASRAA